MQETLRGDKTKNHMSSLSINNKGIKLMSEREADKCAEHGEVLRWSPDSEVEQTKD